MVSYSALQRIPDMSFSGVMYVKMQFFITSVLVININGILGYTMTISIQITDEQLDKIIKKVVKQVRDEFLREIFKDIIEILREIMKTLRELAEAQKRTEERLNALSLEVQKLAEAQKRTEERLNSLIGEVSNLRGELVEFRVINSLDRLLSRYDFVVYSAPPELKVVDAIVEANGFIGLMEICRKCEMKDVRQVTEGARIFEEIEGIKPDVLIIFSYTGEISKDVVEEAKKKGIIVESSIRRLAKRLVELREKRQSK